MRELKFHEKKLLKKVNFYNWKSERTVRQNGVLSKFHTPREDYEKYNKLTGQITKCVAQLRKLDPSDTDRIKMTEVLLEKLYAMGVIPNKQSLEVIADLHTSAFMKRRLSTVLRNLHFAQDIHQAEQFIRQGHVRVGPEVVSNPAMHVTRAMEDHITWSQGSKIQRHVKNYNDEVDDFDMLGS
eukprot:GEMP01028375.1.p1 GENE.GEMP01028375.1~~GEMP01028375.1.p1  ORF type:complete len:183 (+),score=27.71 GEMP01028375.1:76-624(+)